METVLKTISAQTTESNVEGCRQRCEVEPGCVGFAFQNNDIFYIIGGSGPDRNCYLKSACDEENLRHNNPGVYIYFKGLKEGKNWYFVWRQHSIQKEMPFFLFFSMILNLKEYEFSLWIGNYAQ